MRCTSRDEASTSSSPPPIPISRVRDDPRPGKSEEQHFKARPRYLPYNDLDTRATVDLTVALPRSVLFAR
jgi:hypothetical protein